MFLIGYSLFHLLPSPFSLLFSIGRRASVSNGRRARTGIVFLPVFYQYYAPDGAVSQQRLRLRLRFRFRLSQQPEATSNQQQVTDNLTTDNNDNIDNPDNIFSILLFSVRGQGRLSNGCGARTGIVFLPVFYQYFAPPEQARSNQQQVTSN